MRGRIVTVLGLLALAGDIADAGAASLKVAPIVIERFAPAVAGTLTLTNTGIKPINVQIRVFRWSQADGVETLQPTKDVVASPPATSLTPGTDYTIRVLRIAKAPVAGEEAYRIFVDELPSPEPRNPDTVRLVLRYSIPVFFAAETTEQAKVAWGVTYGKGRFRLSAENSGGSRFKVSGVSLRDAAGRTYELSKGLVGYVLGGASMNWSLADPGRPPKAGPAVISFRGDGAVTDVPVTLRPGG